MKPTIDLQLGDCISIMSKMPDKSVDAIITDPPYNSGLDYGETYDDKKPENEYWDFICNMIDQSKRIANLVIVKHSALKIYEWTHHVPKSRMIIWYKPFSSGFKINGFATHFEPLWVVQGESANWSKDVIEHNSGSSNHEQTTGHPAQMPEGFVSKLLTLTTHKGDVIFDPFMGSGTTGVVCVKLGRSFIGTEINPTFFQIARQRIQEAQIQYSMNLDAESDLKIPEHHTQENLF